MSWPRSTGVAPDAPIDISFVWDERLRNQHPDVVRVNRHNLRLIARLQARIKELESGKPDAALDRAFEKRDW